jgi:hypothetical protein
VIVCRFCGDRFVARAGARFCSGRCRQAAYRKRKRDGVTDGSAANVAGCPDAGATSVTRDAVRLVPMPKRWSRRASVSVAWVGGHGWQEIG